MHWRVYVTTLLPLLAAVVVWVIFPLTVSGSRRWHTSRIDFIISRIMVTIAIGYFVASNVSTDKTQDKIPTKETSKKQMQGIRPSISTPTTIEASNVSSPESGSDAVAIPSTVAVETLQVQPQPTPTHVPSAVPELNQSIEQHQLQK